MVKVYCGKCEWHKFKRYYRDCRHECHHPKNRSSNDDPISAGKDTAGCCGIINADNNCLLFKWQQFKPKWWERLLGITGYGLPHIDPNDIPPMPPVKPPKEPEMEEYSESDVSGGAD